jgi:hypothetical protein
MLIIDIVAVWIVAILLLDTLRPRPRNLVERLAPYVERQVGDEAEAWLRAQESHRAE